MSSLCRNDLKKHLGYNPETGLFVRRIAKSNHPKAQVGMVAGRKTIAGYVSISINNVEYLAHRLAWLFIHGEMPNIGIDHKDLDKTNNRISNQRPATKSQTAVIRGLYSHNTSGIKGVGWHKAANKWRAHMGHVHLGLFSNKQDAVNARQKAELGMFGEFARPTEGLT